MNTPKFNMDNVRTPEQEQRMKNALEKGMCPFCPEGLIEIHQNEILWSNKHWLVTDSPFPYEGAMHHVMIISRDHVNKVEDITPEMWSVLGEAVNYTLHEKNIDGGAMLMRFGDMNKNGSSIEHLHIHIIQGEATQDTPKEERFSITGKLGYGKKK